MAHRIQRQRDTFAYRVADLEKKKTASGFAYRLANDLVEEYTEQLSKEFHDWIDSREGPEGRRGVWPVGGPEVPPGGTAPPADYTQPMGGPLTWWDNIEAFVKERYPAAYRGYRYGEENAAQALDGGRMRMPTQYSLYPDRTVHPPYETGPEAVEKYGYDPRQVAAGFMYLHTNAHMTARPDSRVPLLSRDIDRLSEIFQKRQHMQRVYEQNKERENRAAYRLADNAYEPDVYGTADRMKQEFTDWWAETREKAKGQGSPTPPFNDWHSIERFLAQRYPAAWRGLDEGMEAAQPLLDQQNGHFGDPIPYRKDPYETGPEAVATHGYDPKEIAATMLLLHNEAHGYRTDLAQADFDRLYEIARIRFQQQRAYEQNKVASGYSTVHEKVRKDKGAPSGHSCVDCGSKADHWTYDHSSDSEKTKTNDSLPYSTDTKHYSPRCRSCHNKLDKK